MKIAKDDATFAEHEQYSLEELELRTGVSVRNIRYYTNRAILPPPGKSGRSAVYNAQHRAILELIRELQAHGFTLAAIANYIDQIPDDSSTENIRLHGTLLAPWLSERPELIKIEELWERSGRTFDSGEIEVLEALGLIEIVDDSYVKVATSLLPLGVEMLNAGFPLTAAKQARAALDAHALGLAEELTEIFRTDVWPSYKAHGIPSSAVKDAVNTFKPLTVHGFISAYEQAVNSTKRATVHRRLQSRTDH